ncbi:MAG: dihydrodipicolinate synthase family protein, partial [Planctomycetota bacterium]
MFQPFTGLVAAPHTPFQDQDGAGGALALDVIPVQARHLASTGVSAVFVAGATGEGASLGADEKRDLFETWAEAGPEHGLRVIAQVGGESVREAERLAEHAGGLDGIEALGAIAPTFQKPATAEIVARCLARVAGACPSKALYYYDIPALTGLEFTAHELGRAFEEHVPELRGIKCSRYEGWHVQDYLRANGGKYDVLCGTDEALLSALSLGVRGAVGSTYNFAAPLFLAIMERHASGEIEGARTLQARSVDLVRALSSYGYLAASRALMEHLGVPVGPPRLPIGGVGGPQRDALLRWVDAVARGIVGLEPGLEGLLEPAPAGSAAGS